MERPKVEDIPEAMPYEYDVEATNWMEFSDKLGLYADYLETRILAFESDAVRFRWILSQKRLEIPVSDVPRETSLMTNAEAMELFLSSRLRQSVVEAIENLRPVTAFPVKNVVSDLEGVLEMIDSAIRESPDG